MLLNNLDCDDKEVNKVKTSVFNMKDTLKNPEASEKKFASELEAVQKEYAGLQEQAKEFDPMELYKARQALRPGKEQDAAMRIQKAYGKKYSPQLMTESRREVSSILNEYGEERSIRERVRRTEIENRYRQKAQQPTPKRKSRGLER